MDRYVRGRQTEAGNDEPANRPRVNAPYRQLVGIIWIVGVVLLVLAPFAGAEGVVAVYAVTHLFLAGFVRADILALRRQGIDWGHSRHLWFAATLILPLVAPAYYLYSGRRIDAENGRRGFDAGEGGDRDGDGNRGDDVDGDADADAADADVAGGRGGSPATADGESSTAGAER
jgi:hypothetical protein